MKKINLIKRLWKTDSHEKQTPQRFGRYAAMLLLLLTCVTHAWAKDVYAVNLNLPGNGSNTYCHNWGSSGTSWPGTKMSKWSTMKAGSYDIYTCALKNAGNTNCIFSANGSNQTADLSFNSKYPQPTYANGSWWYSPRLTSAIWGSAHNVKGGYLYFDNTNAQWSDTYMYLVAGHDTWIQYWRLTKIDHTKLYSCNITNANWGDAKFMAIMGNSSSETTGSSQNTSPNTLVNKNHFSDALSQALTSGNTYMVSMTSGTNCTPISVASQTTGYSYYNHAQTVYKYTSTDNGSSYSAASINSGTVTITPYKLTAQGTASNSSNTGTINTAGTTSVSKDAVFTGEVTLTASANTGYTFVGWFESASGGSAISTNTTYTYNAPNTTKAIYARFKENRYSLTFSHNGHGTISVGGSTVASGSTAYVNYSTTKTLVATPNTGYNFSGWTKSGSNTGSVTIGNTSNASTTIKATNTGATITAGFTPMTTTITFNKQSGTGGSDGVTATYDAAMPAITLPTRDGYTFGGYWGAPGGSGPKYYNADGSSNATWLNTESTYTLFAAWVENKSSISLVASPTGKGSFTIGGAAATSTTAGVATTRSVTAVPISGYHFVSWSITGGATISGTTDNPVTVTGDGTGTAATLTATFEVDAASYTITYGVGTSPNNNGTVSEGHSYASGSSQTAGTQISLTATPTNAHYKLAGWYSEAACSSAIAGAGTDNPYVFDLSANTSVYAKLVLKQCTITLNKNGGSTGASSVTASHGSTLPSFTAHSRTGYTLDGYYTDPSTGTKIIDASGALVASTTYANASKQWNNDATSLTLYAHWTAKQTTVTLNQQSGSSGTTGVTATYDAAMPDATMPTRTGYTFGGYYTETGGAGTQYYTNTGASARNWDIEDATKTLYAKWTLITYTITYNNMTGATNHPSNPANYNVTTATITLGTPTKAGYDFGGWFTDNGTWKNQVTSIALGSTGNKVLYAKWTAKTYDITYVDANNVATIAANPATGSTDATINFTVTMKPGFKSLSVTAVDAGSNTVTVTNPSSNNYRFTMPASAVTVTVTATALPVVYVLKTKHASSSLGDGATGFPSDGKIWAWKASGSNNFYTSPGDFPGPTASSKATAITDDIIGDEWYRFIPDNISQFDGSTAYHVILTSTGRILDTQSTFIENGSSHSAATHTGTIWIVPHGTDANTAYLYTSYPDEVVTPYNVTYNAGDHGSINVFGTTITSGNSQTIATTKNRTLTATPASGYEFNRWITTGSVTVADATSATTTVSATGAGGTVTATYFEAVNSGWYIKGNPAGNNWDTPTTHPLNRVLPGETNVYYRPVTLPANDQYFRFWNDDGNSTQYGADNNNQAVTKGTKYNLNYNNGNAFKYSAGGTVWFVVDASGATKKFWLQDPVEFYSVNFGYGEGCDEFTAKDGEDHDLVSGNTYVSGTALTFTQTTKDGYTFVGWNTAADGSGSSLGTGSSYSVASLSADVNVYAIYTENKTAITITTDGHGTITTPSPNKSPYSLGVATTQAINASASTGYHWNTWTTSGNAVLVSSAATQSNTVKGNGTDGGTGTVTATFTANSYSVKFNGNGNTGGSMSNQAFTYDAAQNLTENAFTKTGYNFAGWALSADAAVTYADGANVSNLTATNDGTFNLYAKWTPKTTAITLSQTGAATTGSVTSRTGTYDADMPAISGANTLPVAPNGYAYMGYYDALEPLGTQYYNADGTSAHTWDKEDAAVTLYAYFKKAEITSVTFDDDIVEPGATITATANISPTPTGTTTVCWRLLHDNGNEYDPQPTFTPASGATVSFTVPETSTYYKVEAKLRTGNDCAAGTLLDTETGRFRVAGSHTVTVNYKYSSTTIKASTSVTATPLAWSDDITAPDIFGYTFSNWTAADGVTIKDSEHEGETSSTEATIKIQATYNGSLTANYTPKNIIYFKDNLEWTDPEDENAHIYVNLLIADYWNESNGTGNEGVTNRNLQMDRVPGTTDIFYYDYGSKPTSNYISFTKESMDNYTHFYQAGSAHVVFPSRALDALSTNNASGFGFYAATPMFVPLATQTPVKKNNNHATYYNDGYWTKYLPGTGYTLQIYNEAGNSLVKEIAFTSADELMPMKVVTDLEGSHTYKFQLKRDGDVYYGNNGTMTYADHGQNTPWDFYNNSPFNMCTIVTNAAGDYTFNLSYAPNSGGTQNRLRMKVDYPVANGDYRLVYTDDTRSYIVDAVTKYRPKPSAIVNKVNDGTAIVSFFVRHDQNPKLYIQQASVNPSTGAITWNEYPTSGTPTNKITGTIASTISSGGTDVYNFNLSMNGSGALSVTSATKYTGNYYIRTDAANSKWDNYSSDPDHLMTYSEYSITHGGYTHYYVHWVDKDDTGRKNVKFVIANDYSPCISDTLAREEASGTWANIASFIEEGGDLKRSANVRFMWDKRDNSISRAYVDGAQGDYSTNFLYMLNVEASADKIKKSDGTALTDHKVTFKDNGNWMYEANIKAQPTARIKLLSNWGTENTITQYFRGTSETTEQLLGGSGSNWYDIRVIYDFKTNRLIAGLVPEGNIEDPMAIHADVMFIREHHGDITQLTFTEDGAITDIETAFGVLQLNKWTINNKSKAEGHAPLSPLLSRYERDLFYVSFPFRVAMEDVFGFGTYGVHWIIEYYDGASRAANGYWQESGPNWKFVLNRKNQFFEPNQGYIIAIELDEMNEGSSVWANTDVVELYFPSYGSMPDITSSSVTHELPEHECTINRSEEIGGGGLPLGPAYDRRVKDSHWNVMSVPTYVNPGAPDFANTDWITTADDTHVGPNFLYEWNKDDNTVTAVSGTGYTYHAMHAYLVQYCGNVTWTSSVSPASAPRLNPAYRGEYQFRLELLKNDVKEDQTFVKLSDNENVTTGFEFNYDLSKEFNSKRANIYTLIQNNESVENAAGNVLPLTGQKTIVPVGVQIQSEGEYTFSMPDGTEGIGITLIDNETGEHTNLGLTDYTVNLNAGSINDRFVLEISPVSQTTTDIETVTEDGLQITGARKVMIDGILYIVRDGQVFDARGARVQ